MALLHFPECCPKAPWLCSVSLDRLRRRINRLNSGINAVAVIVFAGPFTRACLCPPRDPVWR